MLRERIKNMTGPLARPIFGPLGWLEERLLPDYQLQYSPIFIVGPPRSGTTLLSQLVTYTLATCYFTNLASRLRVQGIRRPPVVLSAWLAKQLKLIERREETFKSSYGRTQGWASPNDSAMIWGHWFSNRFTGPDELTPEAQRAVYQIVAGTEKVFDAPFVDKAAENSVRVGALVQIFPNALFLRCIRNPLAVAQSIYIARTQSGYPVDRWFSTRPKELQELRSKDLVEQVSGQVYFTEQNITEGLSLVSPDRILPIEYKKVCYEPQNQVKRIADFMNHHSAPTQQLRAPPTQFPYSYTRRLDVATYQLLIDQLERFYGYEMTRLGEPSCS